jgi:multidrug/hemolysin transport system permease protein
MGAVRQLVKRNLLVFFRDRAAVFFSFLSVLIIIGLYGLFLADMQVSGIKELAGDVPGIRYMVDSWIMAGLLAVNTVTVSLGALAIMVRDQDKKVLRDFMVAPLKRTAIVVSYILSSLAIGMVISAAGLVLMEAYIVIAGGELLSVLTLLKVLGVTLLGCLSATALMFLITTFIRSMSAFSTISAIVGTLIGFIAGVYVPTSMMPAAVQDAVLFFPTTYTAALLRQLFMEVPMQEVFAEAPASALADYQEAFGVTYRLGGETISPELMLAYLVGLTLLLVAASVVRVRYWRLG